MLIGMPVMFEFSSIEENLKKAVEAKIDFVELNLNFNYVSDELLNRNITKILLKYPLRYTLHFYDEADFSLQKELILSYIKSFKKWANKAKKLNIISINIHLNIGRIVTISGKKKYINELYFEKYIKNIISNLKLLDKIATKNKIILTIENIKSINHIINTYKYLDDFNLTYDIGHDLSTGNNLIDIFKKHKPFEIHMHGYKDNSDHLALSNDTLDINKYVDLISDDTLVLLEVKEYSAFLESVSVFRQWMK